MKRKFIKDPLWGQIEIFDWENKILGHYLFNRLHNIVQLSCAYRVYPGLRFTRFLHSIGVMHVATEIFSNLDLHARSLSLSKNHENLEKLEALNEESALIQKILQDEGLDESELHAKALLSSLNISPLRLASLMALRIAALCHDIGHLPYSHVLEHALKSFSENSDSKAAADLQEAVESQKAFFGYKKKLHETLGFKLMKLLYLESDDPLSKALLSAASVILHKKSLKDDSTYHLAIHSSILMNDVDADRIDYIRRDGFMSGLYQSNIDFQRLFSNFEIVKHQKQEGQIRYLARPSHNAISDIERLFHERFLDYKYIISHHKVHQYDEIIERLSVEILHHNAVPNFIPQIIKILNLQNSSSADTIDKIRQFIIRDFDDTWLEMTLRQHWLNPETTQDDSTSPLFRSFIESRKEFQSAFKTDEDFHQSIQVAFPNFGLEQFDTVAISKSIRQHKFELEKNVSKIISKELGQNITIIVGDAYAKISGGISDLKAAGKYGCEAMKIFLQAKQTESMLFNFWLNGTELDKELKVKITQSIIRQAEAIGLLPQDFLPFD